MNWKTWFPLVLAVVLALVAAKLTHDVIAGKKSSTNQNTGMVQVVVARGDLMPGATLTRDNLTLAPIPGTVAPAHTYTSTDDLVDRVTLQPLVQGQPVNEKLLAPKGSGSGLQAMVPPGMRAITLEVTEFTGLSGMIAPGMTVDVVGTFRDDASHDTVTKTVVQNLKVLAVGPRMTAADPAAAGDAPKEQYKSVTLLGTPKEAEKCDLAVFACGKPRLLLRSGRDTSSVASLGQKLSDLTNSASSAMASTTGWFNTMLTNYRRTQPQNWQQVPATTQPSDSTKTAAAPADPFDVNRPIQRKMQIIRNGVESSTMFELPRLAVNSDLMTGTQKEEQDATGK